MADVDVASATILEGSDFWFTTRWRKADGTDLLITDVSSWSAYIYDEGAEIYSILNQSPAALPLGVFSNSLLGPDGYSDKKYNFRHRMPGAAWTANGGHTYNVLYVITTTQFGKMKELAFVKVVPTNDE